MGLEYAALLHCLKKRFDSCLDEYIKELLTLNAEQLIESASEIQAIKETHYEMRFWIELSMCKTTWPNCMLKEPIQKQDAIALLSLDNPLRDLGLKWWFYTFGNRVNFQDFYKALNEDNAEQKELTNSAEREVVSND